MSEFGVIWMPRGARKAVEVAQRAEAAGITRLGICDSPILYHDVYAVITACLLQTEKIRICPNVTNAVARHWTTHAATMRTLEEFAPGRFFLGIAAGDGAVHSVGLKPHGPRALEEAIREIRAAAPENAEIHLAAGGPLKAAVAGRVADVLLAGGGLEPEHVFTLRGCAETARKDAGIDGPAQPVWTAVNIHLVERESDVPKARESSLPVAVGYARHVFDYGFEGKGVPAEYQDALRERMGRYRFTSHASLGGANPNGTLLSDVPEVEDYVVRRFHLIGTPEACAERLGRYVEESKVDGVWLNMTDPDPIGQLELIGRMTDVLHPAVA